MSEGRDSYLVLFDFAAVEEDEIDLVKGEVGRRTVLDRDVIIALCSRLSPSYLKRLVTTTTGKERLMGGRDSSPTGLLRRRSTKLSMISKQKILMN